MVSPFVACQNTAVTGGLGAHPLDPRASTVMLLHYGSSPLTLNPFQYILEFGTTHRVALCVVHPRFTKSNQIYNKSQN